MASCSNYNLKEIFSSYDPSYPDAYSNLKGGPLAPCINGDIYLYQLNAGVYVKAYITGIPIVNPTGSFFHGFHIHQYGNCDVGESSNPFSASGGHFNPTNKTHPMHAGDLPPILASNGIGVLSFFTDAFNVDEVIGKSFILHEKPDDFTTQPSGNSGNKWACGVIIPYKS